MLNGKKVNSMRINTKISIAIHCLIFIFNYTNKTKVTSELLAKSTGCNPVIIRKIMNMLQKADIIYIKRGVGGAYLKQEPSTISLWDIYYALEPYGLNSLIAMHPNPSSQCPVGQRICSVLNESYKKISDAVRIEMQKITLQDFLDCYDLQSKNN